MMDSKANQKRKHILNSATQFILENSFSDLTLEAVAKQAGISKGGLLYHFPNKDLLIKGIAEHIFEDVSMNFTELAESDPKVTGKWCRALIESSKLDLENMAEQNVDKLALSLLNLDAAKDISEMYQSILVKLDKDGIDPITATMIRLVIDGLYYSEMLNIAPLEKDKQEKIFQRLFQMTEKET
ncbi:TetR/AcrR family transcriptional regulator [Cytobacillus horneckiae]|uniref:TetR/AcrR family transcriptional regulator n=1 Tax=Cytobacillus horneckiae TaxID=549687 RepID=UPI0034CDB48E